MKNEDIAYDSKSEDDSFNDVNLTDETIDDDNQNIDYTITPETLNELQEEQKNSNNTKKRIIITVIFINFLITFIYAIVFCYNVFYVKKTYEIVPNFDNLPFPYKIEATGEINKRVKKINFKYEIMADYVLYGKVASKYHSSTTKGIISQISNYDFAMVYGDLLKDNNSEQIKFTYNNDRSMDFDISSNLSDKLGGEYNVIDLFLNIQMIHKDENVLKKIKKVKEGDHIKIVGQIVHVNFETEDLKGDWPSCYVDNSECLERHEVVLVTDIIWLKLQ